MTLQQLRQAPQQALTNTIYYLTPPGGNPGPTGGLTGQQGIVNGGLCLLAFTPTGMGGVDYFSPYGHGTPRGGHSARGARKRDARAQVS